jgi:hypothetical protein
VFAPAVDLEFGAAVTAYNNIFANYPSSIADTNGSDRSSTEDFNDFFTAAVTANVISGGHSLTSDPQFIDPANGDYRLKVSSPVIDAGDNTALPVDLLADLDNLPRRTDVATRVDTGIGPAPVVDMGAYEFNDFIIFQNGFELP